jgi:hypothetical protein
MILYFQGYLQITINFTSQPLRLQKLGTHEVFVNHVEVI